MAETASFSTPTNDPESEKKQIKFSLKNLIPYTLPLTAFCMVIGLLITGSYAFTQFIITKPTANESIYRLERHPEASQLIGTPITVWQASQKEFHADKGYTSIVTMRVKGENAFGKVVVTAIWENDSWNIKQAVLYSEGEEKVFLSSS